MGILPSHQLLWFLASIYLNPGFEPLISQRWVPRFYPLGHRVGPNTIDDQYVGDQHIGHHDQYQGVWFIYTRPEIRQVGRTYFVQQRIFYAKIKDRIFFMLKYHIKFWYFVVYNLFHQTNMHLLLNLCWDFQQNFFHNIIFNKSFASF